MHRVHLTGGEAEEGGGLANDGGEVVLYHTAVVDNLSEQGGGGIWNAGPMRIYDSTIRDNVSVIGGAVSATKAAGHSPSNAA